MVSENVYLASVYYIVLICGCIVGIIRRKPQTVYIGSFLLSAVLSEFCKTHEFDQPVYTWCKALSGLLWLIGGFGVLKPFLYPPKSSSEKIEKMSIFGP